MSAESVVLDALAKHRIYTGACRGCSWRIPQDYLASAHLTNEACDEHRAAEVAKALATRAAAPTSDAAVERDYWKALAQSRLNALNARAAAPVEAGLADVLIVPMGCGQDAIQVIHEPCGVQLLATMTVHLDTLVGIADRHACPAPAAEPDEWCREESCTWGHWRSGDMPTHRRGADCPAPAADGGACPDFWPNGEHLDPPTESCECHPTPTDQPAAMSSGSDLEAEVGRDE